MSAVTNIAANGDIILVVGPERMKLRVQSLALKAASQPFSAMLDQRWRRPEQTTAEVSELLLPDDDAVGMRHICIVLHHQNKRIPDAMTVHDILKVAVLADKYDFVDAFKFASTVWLAPKNKGAGEIMILATAALLFRNAQAFREGTKALIIDYGGSYLSLVDEELQSIIDWRITHTLNEQRADARLKLAEILIKGFNSGACCHSCGWSSKHAYAYLQALEGASLLPTGIQNISDAITQANKMPHPSPTEPSSACTYSYKHAAPAYTRDRQWALDYFLNHIGLCLYCVQSNQFDSTFCERRHR